MFSRVGWAILLGLAACAIPSGGERLVEGLPDDPWWFSVSEGGRSAAYVERRGSEAFLTVDGRRSGPFV